MTGVNTLAYGHYRITRKVHDIRLIERSGEDLVYSAEQAASKLIRPGRPWPHHFPLGEEPVAATQAHSIDCADAALLRLNYAEVQILNGELPSAKIRNSALVNSIVNAVLEEHFRGAIDFNFDAEDILALHEVAVSYRDNGASDEDLRDYMLDLTATLREITVEEDGSEDGEVDDDEI